MTNEQIKQQLIDKFGDLVYHFEEPYGMLTFETATDNNLKVLTFCMMMPKWVFTFSMI